MHEASGGSDRRSIAVRISFLIVSITAYSVIGYYVGELLATWFRPEVLEYLKSGGALYFRPGDSMDPRDEFNLIWAAVVCAMVIIGAVVGNGFYIAWQRR